jgi:hypothetical protein
MVKGRIFLKYHKCLLVVPFCQFNGDRRKISCNLALLPFQKLSRVLYFHGANQLGQDDSLDFRVWVSLELKVP